MKIVTFLNAPSLTVSNIKTIVFLSYKSDNISTGCYTKGIYSIFTFFMPFKRAHRNIDTY